MYVIVVLFNNQFISDYNPFQPGFLTQLFFKQDSAKIIWDFRKWDHQVQHSVAACEFTFEEMLSYAMTCQTSLWSLMSKLHLCNYTSFSLSCCLFLPLCVSKWSVLHLLTHNSKEVGMWLNLQFLHGTWIDTPNVIWKLWLSIA